MDPSQDKPAAQRQPNELSADKDVVKPVIDEPAILPAISPQGRVADKLAAIIAATGLGLSILLSGMFFAGFVVNDYYFGAISSAFVLTIFLGSFAIVPISIILILARRAYRYGANLALYSWVLGLIIPWLSLSCLCLIFTPLPIWMSVICVIFALTLTIWAMVSLFLELKARN